MKTQYQICLFATAPISVSGWICGKLKLGSPSAKTPPPPLRARDKLLVSLLTNKQTVHVKTGDRNLLKTVRKGTLCVSRKQLIGHAYTLKV